MPLQRTGQPIWLHPLPPLPDPDLSGQQRPAYWYEGVCPTTGHWLRLPRTALVDAIAHWLMQQLEREPLYSHEGKMYGVLLVQTPGGDRYFLKAFSGLLNGAANVAGWVPPLPGRDQVALAEASTLAQLESIKQALIALYQRPERQHYEARSHHFDEQWQLLSQQHRQRKQARQQQRQALQQTGSDADQAIALAQLDAQSRQDGLERRRFKQHRDAELAPLKHQADAIAARIGALKHQRRDLSRQLQAQMHRTYWVTNFAGEAQPLHQLMDTATMPTGTGDCCAPKLLHHAATHHLIPLALAEFWWGPPSPRGDRVQGQFYGACEERCQPLMGFLLSGLSSPWPDVDGRPIDGGKGRSLPILYQDDEVIVVNKPAGLLSVPGRGGDRWDSVLSRLQALAVGKLLRAVHRLDQDTSGILVLACTAEAHRHLSRQFQARTVHKVYEAVVEGAIAPGQGTITLPLWADPSDRPYQKVDWQRGKPSVTQFRTLTWDGNRTRVEFIPITGRTHQLRVHAAHAEGLGTPILGDRLYGHPDSAPRLHLHARELNLVHPTTGQRVFWMAETPF